MKLSNIKRALEWAERLEVERANLSEVKNWEPTGDSAIRISVDKYSMRITHDDALRNIQTSVIAMIEQRIKMIENTLEIFGVTDFEKA